jgi:protein-S-isoprenylcysteine O-methyltransferase Ste14
MLSILGINMNTFDFLVIISLIIFYILFLGRTVLLYKNGIKVWVIGTSTKKLFEIILENLLFPVLLLWSIFVVITALDINLPQTLSKYLINIFWLKYIGILFCYIGLIIFLLALISFGKAWRIGIDQQNSNDLITSGIFKHTRNPIFLFMDIYCMGITLIYPNIIFVVVTFCMIMGIHLQIIREEQFLINKFEEKYMEYKKQTRRYI